MFKSPWCPIVRDVQLSMISYVQAEITLINHGSIVTCGQIRSHMPQEINISTIFHAWPKSVFSVGGIYPTYGPAWPQVKTVGKEVVRVVMGIPVSTSLNWIWCRAMGPATMRSRGSPARPSNPPPTPSWPAGKARVDALVRAEGGRYCLGAAPSLSLSLRVSKKEKKDKVEEKKSLTSNSPTVGTACKS